VGPLKLMSAVLQRCEALMLQSKVQFVLSHSHADARGALDREPFQPALIGEDTLVAVSAPDKVGAPQHPQSRRRRSTVPILAYTSESGLGRIVQAATGHRLEPIPVETVLTAHLASVLRTMVLDGRGIAWLPRTLIDDDLVSGRLVAAAGPDWLVPLEIRLYRDAPAQGQAREAFWSSAARRAPSAPA